MNRSRWRIAVGVVWALIGVQAGLLSAARAAPPAKDHFMTVNEPGKPSVRCRVLRAWSEKEGHRDFLLQAVDSKELITIVETKKPGGAGSGAGPTISVRAIRWVGTKPPPGTPMPPGNAQVYGNAEPMMTSTAAAVHVPVVSPRLPAAPSPVKVAHAPREWQPAHASAPAIHESVPVATIPPAANGEIVIDADLRMPDVMPASMPDVTPALLPDMIPPLPVHRAEPETRTAKIDLVPPAVSTAPAGDSLEGPSLTEAPTTPWVVSAAMAPPLSVVLPVRAAKLTETTGPALPAITLVRAVNVPEPRVVQKETAPVAVPVPNPVPNAVPVVSLPEIPRLSVPLKIQAAAAPPLLDVAIIVPQSLVPPAAATPPAKECMPIVLKKAPAPPAPLPIVNNAEPAKSSCVPPAVAAPSPILPSVCLSPAEPKPSCAPTPAVAVHAPAVPTTPQMLAVLPESLYPSHREWSSHQAPFHVNDLTVKTEVQQRLDRLERDNRWWRGGACGFMIGFALVLTTAVITSIRIALRS